MDTRLKEDVKLLYPGCGWLYIVRGQFWPEHCYKIGETTNLSVNRRLRDYQTHNPPGTVHIVKTWPCKDVKFIEQLVLRKCRVQEIMFQHNQSIAREFVTCPIDKLYDIIINHVGLVLDLECNLYDINPSLQLPCIEYLEGDLDTLDFCFKQEELMKMNHVVQKFEQDKPNTIKSISRKSITKLGKKNIKKDRHHLKGMERHENIKNLYWNSKRRAWVVNGWFEYNHYYQTFSISKYKSKEDAFQEACKYRNEKFSRPRQTLCRIKKDRGVYFDKRLKKWIASIQIKGKRDLCKFVTCPKLGPEDLQAKQAALDWRKQKLLEISSFIK